MAVTEEAGLAEAVSGIVLTEGYGSVRYWAAFEPRWVALTLDAVRKRFNGSELRVIDLEQASCRPWAPFADLALEAGGRVPRTYFRHRHLFRGSTSAPEPLIDDELGYEKCTLADALLRRLALLGPIVVFVRHAELLSPEALFLAERFRESATQPVVLLFCFETRPRNDETFDRLDTLGYLSWVGPPPLTALSGPFLPRTVAPSPPDRRELMRWLCYETVAQSEEASVDKLEALAVLGDFDAGIELGEALLRRATAAELRPIWTALARLYRAAGDTASAARYLTLAWKESRDMGDEAGLAHTDFLLFENSYRTLVVEDVYLGLEDRLVASLESLGWLNHRAAVLGKNIWVQTVGRLRGWDVAHQQWEVARALVDRTGNLRRRGVLLQTLGSLKAIAGDWRQALNATRRAVLIARKHSTALHTAKVENGLGYLYFSSGDFHRARTHHALALRLLLDTGDHAEYVGTLVNLGRLYLFNDQAEQALPLLTTAVRAMDGLGLSDLPFHPRSNTYALLGVCCLKTGQHGRAMEFLKKLRNEETQTERVNDHRLCLEVLAAEAVGDVVRADVLLEETLAFLVPRSADLRHLLVWILLERSRWRLWAGDPERASAALDLVEPWLHPSPLSRDERRHLQALRSGGSRRLPLLAPVSWDSPLLIRFSKQEASLRDLRRTVQDYGFLQVWHQDLLPGMEDDELFERAVVLIRTHFPVDTVAVFDGGEPRLLALAPGSDLTAANRVMNSYGAAPQPHRLPLAVVFPLVHSGVVQARLACIDSHPEPLFGPDDSRVLDLAADHLAVLMLSQRKAKDLEERGAALARALEVLGDTQERLVRSENLAVLGNLAAGLAHELNTPLGAILSASRTVQSLLSGPLTTQWDPAAWTAPEIALFRRLVGLAGKGGSLPDRSQKRELRQRLQARGIADAAAIVDLGAEVGLDSPMLESLADEPSLVKVLERLVPVAQGHSLGSVIEEAAERAGAVVGSLRSYLHGSPNEEETPFKLAAELHSALALLGASRWRKLKVEWEVDPSLELIGRRLALAQVWSNLIQNAVQAMDGKGTLALSARVAGGWVFIDVADDGPGIPESHQDQVLQPFFSTKKQTGGLGLGLDICRRIVEAHEGRLEFESRPGRTVFTVGLPFERE